MITNILNKVMKKSFLCHLSLILSVGIISTSCSGFLSTDSDLVAFEKDHKLNNVTDSLYSTFGILAKMQKIADRTVILGEMRGDLTTLTDNASPALKAIANFQVDEKNEYNQISDYYAVINNCNYVIANIDTSIVKHGYRVFEAEYAAAKVFRAWTYLQAVLAYGEVPLITEPLMTEKTAAEAINKNLSNINQICDYFINDITPFVDTPLPNMRAFSGSYQELFIPVRLLLADMNLWRGNYLEAAQLYHAYLTFEGKWITTNTLATTWNNTDNFSDKNPNKRDILDEELWLITMESNEADGVISMLPDIFGSTQRNDYYAQAKPSQAIYAISAAQDYCLCYDKDGDGKNDTLYAPKTGLVKDIYRGDLRLNNSYEYSKANRPAGSKYSTEINTVDKFEKSRVVMDRVSKVYLRFAEALNRAGFPESAFVVLKYGLQNTTQRPIINRYIDARERAKAGNLLDFNTAVFNRMNTQGIHARGCGAVDADTLYRMPLPETQLATYEDTVQYQIPLVEDMIVTEMALETAFEGDRFYTLMRVADRRNDPSYLAEPISKRNGEKNQAIYDLLMNKENWYLKK